MAQVFLNVRGNGTAYVDNDAPTQGEEFTIHCIPFDDAQLLDAKLWTSDDQSIAITVSPDITLIYQSIYGNVYADIYFTGSDPQPEPLFRFPWILKRQELWRLRL